MFEAAKLCHIAIESRESNCGFRRTVLNFKFNIRVFNLCWVILLLACNQPVITPPSSSGAPLLIYTDIVSGPNVGGENNKGIYLSLFGKNFGNSLSSLKVFINNVEVDNYRSLGISRARQDIQQVTVQIGALGNPTQGVALPIKVVVNGVASNTDQIFTVIPGNIYFVDNINGVDTTDSSSGGSFTAPFKTVQIAGFSTSFQIQPASVSGAYGRVRAGDFIVMRGGTYSSVGFGSTTGTKDTKDTGYFVNTLNKSGCPIGNNCAQGGGSSSGPITIMGYPTEDVLIDRTNLLGDDKFGGGISSTDSARQGQGFGAYWNISNLRIESGFNDGPINTQRGELNPMGMHWRVVNNELTAASCQISTKCRAGAIAGNGAGNVWLGNYGHDVFDKSDGSTDLENHGIYIGGNGSFEIAYNVLEKIPGGSGLQLNGSDINNVSFHHNIVRNVGKHGINLANGSQTNITIWNNLIYDTYYAGLRMQDDTMKGMKLFNNTFYNTNTSKSPAQGALTNDTNAAPNQIEIRNNIFWAASGTAYASGCCNADFSGGVGVISNNLWFQTPPVAAPSFDTVPKTGDPLFVAAGTDFHLGLGSPAIDSGSATVSAVVSNDFDLVSGNRPKGNGFDIGAFER
jgi:hypothetical protein